MRRPLAALALLLALIPGAAGAQPRAAATSRPTVGRGDQTALRAQFGIPVAQRLLQQSDSVAGRVRAVERLGSIGTPEAIDVLVEAIEGSSAGMADARIRLTAVRVLAGETKRANVRKLLLKEVTDTLRGGVVSPLTGLLRGTAALALARGGDRQAVTDLALTLLRPGSAAEAATLALRVHPPESLDALVETKRAAPASPPKGAPPPEPAPESKRRLSAPIATFLGEIGDLRAVERLRPMLAEGEPAGKIAAAQALARLGDEAALPLAREWQKLTDPKLRLAAANVLVTLDAPEATEAVKTLLESESGRDEGIRLSLRAPATALAQPLAKLLPSVPEDVRPRVIAAIGRARGAAELSTLLDKPESAAEAAFALGTMPGNEAREALAQALAGEVAKKPEGRRLLLRAAIVRALSLGDPPSGLRSALKELRRAEAAADRAVGTFGLVAIGSLSLADALEAACKEPADEKSAPVCDPAIVGAAARGALATADGPSSLAPLLRLLTRLGDRGGPVTIAAGAALLAHPDGADIPTLLLATLAEAGGPLSPLAARALPARDDEALRGRIKRLLEGSDPVVRAHVALGLGRDPEPNAVTLLTDAYRFEEDAQVRRAIVRALSIRTEAQRALTLTRARDLDPDDETRSLARAALDGRDLSPALRPARGAEPRRGVAWITVRESDGKTVGQRAVRLVRSDGLSVPALSDPDGVLLVPGLPPGPASLSLDRP